MPSSAGKNLEWKIRSLHKAQKRGGASSRIPAKPVRLYEGAIIGSVAWVEFHRLQPWEYVNSLMMTQRQRTSITCHNGMLWGEILSAVDFVNEISPGEKDVDCGCIDVVNYDEVAYR